MAEPSTLDDSVKVDRSLDGAGGAGRTDSPVVPQSVPWWSTTVGEDETEAVVAAIRDRRIAMGPLTEAFEAKFAARIGARYAVATPSGSVALAMSLHALGIGVGDEVLVPNRTFIATAHAVQLVGAHPVLVEVEADVPRMDLERMEDLVTSRTRAVLPVHLNGRAVDMTEVRSFASRHGLAVIEDACQAMFSRGSAGYLGTESDVGCYSLGVAKLITCGYGGVAVCHEEAVYRRLTRLRNHGVLDPSKPQYDSFGFNCKFSDMLAAIASVQLDRASLHIARVCEIYETYREVVDRRSDLSLIPVEVERGEVPLYAEVVSRCPERWRSFLERHGVQCQSLAPSLDRSPHFATTGCFERSHRFDREGFMLPCGPTQPRENTDWVVHLLGNFDAGG